MLSWFKHELGRRYGGYSNSTTMCGGWWSCLSIGSVGGYLATQVKAQYCYLACVHSLGGQLRVLSVCLCSVSAQTDFACRKWVSSIYIPSAETLLSLYEHVAGPDSETGHREISKLWSVRLVCYSRSVFRRLTMRWDVTAGLFLEVKCVQTMATMKLKTAFLFTSDGYPFMKRGCAVMSTLFDKPLNCLVSQGWITMSTKCAHGLLAS